LVTGTRALLASLVEEHLVKTWKSVRDFQRLGKTYIFWHILHGLGRSEIV